MSVIDLFFFVLRVVKCVSNMGIMNNKKGHREIGSLFLSVVYPMTRKATTTTKKWNDRQAFLQNPNQSKNNKSKCGTIDIATDSMELRASIRFS